MSEPIRSHARRNQLTGEWVLVSPDRLSRPWDGQIENTGVGERPSYDANCYLCPGNVRANNDVNPDYKGSFSFDNDFPALSDKGELNVSDNPSFVSRSEAGRCRVLCYSERHDASLASMTVAEIVTTIESLISEFSALDTDPNVAYVQIFENRGEMMGCSNQHPHAQVWATENLPNEPAKELESQKAWFEKNGSSLLQDYLASELTDGTRIVIAHEHFVALVPYWAIWPFETLILPRVALSTPDQMQAEQVESLAIVWKALFTAYNTLFGVDTPYSMGLHPSPSDGNDHPEWQFHMHIYPPLLRSASVRKHLVGFEMLAMPQRDLTAEVAAEKLRLAAK